MKYLLSLSLCMVCSLAFAGRCYAGGGNAGQNEQTALFGEILNLQKQELNQQQLQQQQQQQEYLLNLNRPKPVPVT